MNYSKGASVKKYSPRQHGKSSTKLFSKVDYEAINTVFRIYPPGSKINNKIKDSNIGFIPARLITSHLV